MLLQPLRHLSKAHNYSCAASCCNATSTSLGASSIISGVLAFFKDGTSCASLGFLVAASLPRVTASANLLSNNKIDCGESSFAGITKSINDGSELVSTIPTTGIPIKTASFTADCSLVTSTTTSAPIGNVNFLMPPTVFSSLSAVFLYKLSSFLV